MSEKKIILINYFFNVVKTLSNLIFPLITFTYTSRVLGVEGIGSFNFARSYTGYYILLASLGMSSYGVREAAKIRDSKSQLSTFAQEMLCINFFSTIISIIAMITSIFLVKRLQNYTLLLMINGVSILLNGLSMEWLYSAMEKYRYITIRSLVFQIISIIMMVLLVHDSKDLAKYAAINVFSASGSYILNFINCRKYISFTKREKYNFKKHIKPLCILFAMTISVSLYALLDSTMLGFMQSDSAVGLYTAGIKMNKLSTALITALGVVLVPRLSYYYEKGEKEKFMYLVQKAYKCNFLLSVPICVGIGTLGKPIILLLSGCEFLDAQQISLILTPIIIFIPFSILTSNQILIPMRKDTLVLKATCVGAITNFVANMFLIPRFSYIGAAIGTVLAEGVVMIANYMYAKKNLDMKNIMRGYWKYWIAAFPILLITWEVMRLVTNNILVIFYSVATSAMVYFLILLLLREEMVLEGLTIILNFGKRKRRKANV